MKRVFILEPPTVNVSKASDWGEIQILFPEGLDRSPLDSEYYGGLIVSRLEELEYDKNNDFITIVGSMTSMAVMTAVLVARFRAFKALLFNAEHEAYVLRVIGRWRASYERVSDKAGESSR